MEEVATQVNLQAFSEVFFKRTLGLMSSIGFVETLAERKVYGSLSRILFHLKVEGRTQYQNIKFLHFSLSKLFLLLLLYYLRCFQSLQC